MAAELLINLIAAFIQDCESAMLGVRSIAFFKVCHTCLCLYLPTLRP
jgi:hypothetical protein